MAKNIENKPKSLWCTGSFNPSMNGPRTKLSDTDLAVFPYFIHSMPKNDSMIKHLTA